MTLVKDMAFGLAAAGVALWLTFFAGPGTVEMATLLTSVVALVWFATVERSRLVDERRRPNPLLFGLATLGAAFLVTGAAIIASGTVLLTLGVGMLAVVVGLVRALRYAIDSPRE